MTHTEILEAWSELRAAKNYHHPQNKWTFFLFCFVKNVKVNILVQQKCEKWQILTEA